MNVPIDEVGGVVKPMTSDEVRAFLTAGTRTGKLAWVSRNGAPHVAPIWFVLDGDNGDPEHFTVVFNTHTESGKYKALRREGRASLVVDDQTPPYSFVKIDGTISFDDDLERVRSVATEIGGRYMGPERAEEFGARNGVAGEVIVRLTPANITGEANVSD